MAEAQEDFKSLPLPDRFVHKNWKVRKEGYEDAAKEFETSPDESAPAFTPFLQDPGLLKGAVADSNVAAQQEGLAMLCAFLKYGGKEQATRSRGHTVPAIVEKGLASTKAASKQSSVEALLLYIEIDRADPIIEDLLPSFAHKQPKVIAASLTALTTIYHNYGVKIVDPKPVLKGITKPFGHADKNVRAEATNLVVELYRWLREAIKPLFWSDLKPLQQQDLEKLFEAVKQEPPPKQERLLRSQQAAPTPAAGTDDAAEGGDDGANADDAPEMDAFDLAEPVDVLPKIPKDFQENMASAKWKDRKEALDAVFVILNVPRIKDGAFDDLVATFVKCMKDANIMVVQVAANCIQALAQGLRQGFAKYRSRVMSPMFERLKEKKQAVADALGAALDAVFASTKLSDCLEDTAEFLKHKNPQVKLETLRFLIRCLRTTREVPPQPEAKIIADCGTKLLTESSEVTRSGGAEILGTLMKILGERPMAPYLDGVDDSRKAKIKEFCDAAEVKAKNKPKPATAPKSTSSAPPARKTLGKKSASTPAVTKKPPPRLGTPEEPPTPAPAPPKSIARPALTSKLTAPARTGLTGPGGAPPSGLKMPQKKLSGPGGAPPPSVYASPKRTITPQGTEGDGVPSTGMPRSGLGRGLTARTLSKPGSYSQTETAATTPAPTQPSGLSALERAELDELRADRERLQALTETLRADKSKLDVELHELRTHEAELIEERTRNRLTIKAKETQLVRARSDADIAEETVRRQQGELDRLKREIARTARATSPPMIDASDQIYRDGGVDDTAAGAGHPSSTPNPSRTALGRDAAGTNPNHTHARPYMTSPSEEKENGGLIGRGSGKAMPSPLPVSRMPPRTASDPNGPGSVPARSSRPPATAAPGGAHSMTSSAVPTVNGDGHAPAEPVESWRRAAEVTSQLKARIEQMKARQNMARH